MISIDAKKVIETRIAESMGFDKYYRKGCAVTAEG